jgi:hypothetical protein
MAQDKRIKAAFHEVHKDTPGIVKKTTAKKGKAAGEKQRVAIALSKARAAGANVPEAPGNSPPNLGLPSASRNYPNSQRSRGVGKTTRPNF